MSVLIVFRKHSENLIEERDGIDSGVAASVESEAKC